MIAYVAFDLLWATRIKRAAEDAGFAARPVRTVEMLEGRLADSNITGLIVDLESESAVAIIERLRGPQAGDRERAIRIVAFGPHVEHERLRGAAAAGADEVLTRGAFDRSLPAVLRGLGSPPDGPTPA